MHQHECGIKINNYIPVNRKYIYTSNNHYHCLNAEGKNYANSMLTASFG